MSLKIENVEIVGWEHAIRGMRNPMNSWNKSDSKFKYWCTSLSPDEEPHYCNNCGYDLCQPFFGDGEFVVGENDLDLMTRLRNAGTDHRKYMRMITVYADITAPLYWWKEFDTYKVGTVANSCSTMHKIHDKEFTIDDFSHEHLTPPNIGLLEQIIEFLNEDRRMFNETRDKDFWWQIIQLLPTSYNQRRTVMLNYEVLANIYKSRKNHKLDEWRALCKWIKDELPYSFLITGAETND